MSAAFLLAGHWVIVGLLAAQIVFWFALSKHSVLWRSSCLLAISVALAAVGTLLGLMAALLLVGTVAALAAWDLLNFSETLKYDADPGNVELLARSHLRALSWAFLIGGLLSTTGLAVHFDLPLPIMGVLALGMAASLARAVHHIGGNAG
jgi:hypothetical protein